MTVSAEHLELSLPERGVLQATYLHRHYTNLEQTRLHLLQSNLDKARLQLAKLGWQQPRAVPTTPPYAIWLPPLLTGVLVVELAWLASGNLWAAMAAATAVASWLVVLERMLSLRLPTLVSLPQPSWAPRLWPWMLASLLVVAALYVGVWLAVGGIATPALVAVCASAGCVAVLALCAHTEAQALQTLRAAHEHHQAQEAVQAHEASLNDYLGMQLYCRTAQRDLIDHMRAAGGAQPIRWQQAGSGDEAEVEVN